MFKYFAGDKLLGLIPVSIFPKKLTAGPKIFGIPYLAISSLKINLNSDLKIKGILLTMFDKRNKLSGQVEKEARDYFKEIVYTTVIPRNVRLSEAPSHGAPVLIYDKLCSGSKAYLSFTDEFLKQENILESAA